MERVFAVARVIAPIFTAILLGVIARRKKLLSQEEVRGLQQYVMKFGLPCVVFNSCLTANMNADSLSSMVLVLAAMLVSALWAFRARRKRFPYWNLPMLFCAKETGMLGIPLVIVLFGAEQAYRMGVLDLTQAIVAFPVIALLTADAGENPSPWAILKKVLASPLMIMSALGLTLNLTGLSRWLDAVGIGSVITESVGFLTQPISAMMIFSVGYNFSLARGKRGVILKISAIQTGMFALFCLLIQGLLFLVPGVDALTRWVILLYCALPASYLAPGLGRTKDDDTVASGVCSVLTAVCLAVFCGIVVAVS